MAKSKQRATYDDLLRLPENMVGEIIDGELIASPRPASPQAFAVVQMLGMLGAFNRHRGAPGGWWIFREPELHLHGDVIVPKLTGWRRERMPRIPNVEAFELAPDWVCEVVSPQSGRVDRVSKARAYAREGVRNFWLVDPLQRTLEVRRLERERWVEIGLHYGDVVVRAEPFEAVELQLAEWWLDEEILPRT